MKFRHEPIRIYVGFSNVSHMSSINFLDYVFSLLRHPENDGSGCPITSGTQKYLSSLITPFSASAIIGSLQGGPRIQLSMEL